MNKYNWKGTNYPKKIDDWKTFEKNNPANALNILYIKEKEISVAYISKHNSTHEKQIILLMIPNEKIKGRWHYLAVKKLSALLHRITSKNKGDFYCLNCLHSFRTENQLKSHEKVCKNKDFCGIVMPSEKDNILEFNQYIKSDKMPYIIYADIESLIKRNNLENSSTTKIGEHIPCIYSMSTIWTFDNIENKHTLYCGEGCMKKFCTSLRKHATDVINFEKKKMLPLTKEELKSYQNAKVCYICGRSFLKKFTNDKNYQKARDRCHYTGKYRGAAHNICILKFNVPNEISVVLCNGSKEFKGEFECPGENTEKYKTFSVPIEKEMT